VVEMTTATNSKEAQARARDPRRQVPRDTTAPVRRGNAAHRDDRSHTPPHGDALLPRRTTRP
jgi:hypothetical protein